MISSDKCLFFTGVQVFVSNSSRVLDVQVLSQNFISLDDIKFLFHTFVQSHVELLEKSNKYGSDGNNIHIIFQW